MAGGDGGLNASVRFELDRPENKGLKRGWRLIEQVRQGASQLWTVRIRVCFKEWRQKYDTRSSPRKHVALCVAFELFCPISQEHVILQVY